MTRRSSHGMQCPPANGGDGARFPGRHGSPLAPDERLAPPETRVEYIGGVEVFAAPADEPHAHQHSQIDRVVGAHVKSPYAVAVDMLTRVDDASDFAPDVSVYEPIVDRKTKEKTGRKLEEIAFEVIDKQAQSVPTKKAMELVARGVRRVFCVVVRDRQLSEWSRKLGRWEPIAPGSLIEDRCFVRPIRADALVSSLLADDEIARALLVKRPPAIEIALQESHTEGREEGLAEGREEGLAEGREEGRAEGREEGRAEALAEALRMKQSSVLRILEKRGLTVSARLRARIAATTDVALLDRWFDEALTVERASDLKS
ncbi:MAG: Uma2 family endonuclease [Polyangiaceae bacterium]